MAKPKLTLSAEQKSLIQSPLGERVFLHGPAGCGKTTVGVHRLLHLIKNGADAGSILVLVPQRTLAAPYYHTLQNPDLPAGAQTSIYTFGGLAQRMVDLFWPLVASQAGFGKPTQAPVFLTLETAQYYMARVARPFFDKGYFEGISLDHNRLFSQLLDNLNKSAVAGFPMQETAQRLKAAWLPTGEVSRLATYDQAQETALNFRQYCLEHNLLDFSLQVEVFVKFVWPSLLGKNFLQKKYSHLIVDNLEEDIPVAHDTLSEWLPDFQSVLLIQDDEGGFRSFLGADPASAAKLANQCTKEETLEKSYVTSHSIDNLRYVMVNQLSGTPVEVLDQSVESAYSISTQPFTPQMTEWVAAQTVELIQNQAVPAGEIVILAPFMSDALRFSLRNALEKLGVPSWSNRPSRSLSEEPATRCLLTLAQLAHPQWELAPSMFDVRYALLQILTKGDLVRADLI
ncbi:MAG TPA: UvrD-helicase domain-containing protein, partial [Longilinea sp.]|nr:UvrD-helicase domain-containing protein [Longilinea sp.]